MEKYGGKLITETKDQFGPIEVVEDEKGRYLHFGTGARQSTLYLDDPFSLIQNYNCVILLSLLFNPEPKSVLILGLGAGGMAKFLWKHFPGCQIDAIEKRDEVVAVAHDHFHLPKDERLNIFSEDAMSFLKKQEKKYDIIIVDLYTADGMPPFISEEPFFGRCHTLLKKGGILCWNTPKNTPEKQMVSSIEALCMHFANRLLILPIKDEQHFDFGGEKYVDLGSNIFIIFKEPMQKITQEQLVKNSEELKKKTGEDFPKLFQSFNRFKGYGQLSFCR